MDLVIYLNEMSCGVPGFARDAVQDHVKNTIAALRAIGQLRRDTALRLSRPVKQIAFGDGQFTFPQLFPGANNDFSVLLRYLDRTPCGPPAMLAKEVVFQGQVGVGLSWAHSHSSFVLSVGYRLPWSAVIIPAQEHSLDETGALSSVDIQVKNLAFSVHVAHWRTKIEDYGREETNSSLLYRTGQFVIRMLLFDHDPPHVHIYAHSDDSTQSLAKNPN